MSDIADQANEHADMLLRQALEAQRRRAARAGGTEGDTRSWQVQSALICEAPRCDEPIPDERRRLLPGVRLCVECQARLERGMGK